MTAQDIDLVPFTSVDSKSLRDKIDSLNIPPTLKVLSNQLISFIEIDIKNT